MPLDAAAITLGQFMLGDGGQKAGRGPTFLVGLLRELGQFVEEKAERCGIGYVVRVHAASPVRLSPSSSS